MSDLFSIQMSRGRVITVAACFVAAGVLFFAAGTVAGLLMASSSVKYLVEAQLREARPPIEPDKKPSVVAAPAPPDSGPTSADGSDQTAPAGSPAAPSSQTEPAAGTLPQQAPPAAAPSSPTAVPPPAPATPASSAPTIASAQKEPTAAEPSAESSYAIPLTIKVCSFSGKASAEAMVTALAAKGYRASLGHFSGAGGRLWYVVKLGPYTEWNTASDVATRIAIAENVRPEIGPVR